MPRHTKNTNNGLRVGITAGNTPTDLPAVTYGRVSTTGQAEDGTSLDEQQRRNRIAVETIGGNVIAHYADEGVSGGLYLYRPQIQKALSLIESGAAKIFCIHHIDRGGRDVDAVRDIAKRIWRHGGTLLVADQGVITPNAVGLANLTFQATSGELLKGLILENTKNGRRSKARDKGEQPSRSVSPYGYHVVTKIDILRGEYPADQVGRYHIVEAEAAIVREMYRRVAEERVSVRSLVKWLFDNGVLSPFGHAQWQNSTISGILRNPVYKGQPLWGRFQWGMDEKRLADGKKRPRFYTQAPPEDVIQLSCDPIIETELWDVVQKKLDTNKDCHVDARINRKYLLSGLLRCPHCVTPYHKTPTKMSGVTKPGGKTDRGKERADTSVLRYYRCQSAQSRQDHVNHCRSGHYNADHLEALVIGAIAEASKDPALLTAAITDWEDARLRALQVSERVSASAPENMRIAAEIARLQEQYAALEKREQATVEAQIAGVAAGADPRFYIDILGRVSSERQEVASAIEALETKVRGGGISASTIARQSILETAIALRATASHAIAALPALIDSYLKDDSVPIAKRHGTLSKIIDRIVPEGEGKPLHVTGARIYLVDAVSRVPARPVAEEKGMVARPDSTFRFLLNGALITLRATFDGKRVPGHIPTISVAVEIVETGGSLREAA